MSGKSGPDTYKFSGIWGYAAVVEYPDLKLGVPLPEVPLQLEIGKGRIVRQGSKVALLHDVLLVVPP